LTRILFVCTGNTCRSPMAEALFRRMAEEAGMAAEARSAGVAALDGQPISKHSKKVLEERGITDDLQSRSLKQEDVAWADLILTMTMHHKRIVIEEFPEAIDKVYTLKEYASFDQEQTKAVQERESLMAKLQLQIAAGQTPDEQDMNRLLELEGKVPNYDIIDPFGGNLTLYTNVAKEIEEQLRRVIERLREQRAADDDPDPAAAN
jgi:Protein-tyrosine-phosphatase